MSALVTALYAEGPTDKRFLPTVIQRTAADLLAHRGRQVTDVLLPTTLEPMPRESRAADNVLIVARQAHGYHILFIHADADAPTPERAHAERIAPGIARIAAARDSGESVCHDIIPVIPVQMVEAWLLADADALRAVLGTAANSDALPIPTSATQIEGMANPKERLSEIVRLAYAHRTRRRRRFDVGELFQPLGEQIRLEQLGRLPAYQTFVADLTYALIQLNFLRAPHG